MKEPQPHLHGTRRSAELGEIGKQVTHRHKAKVKAVELDSKNNWNPPTVLSKCSISMEVIEMN